MSLRIFSLVGLIFCFLLVPTTMVLGQQNAGGSNDTQNAGGSNDTQNAGGPTCDDGSVGLCNPLKADNIMELLNQILDVILVFAVPVIVFMIIYAGFIYVMARGNPGEISRAHKTLLYAIVGGVIILGAKLILVVIKGTVAAFM